MAGASALILLLTVLFYFRPYYGIRHDSILYLGQAYLSMDPDIFGRDLFFVYGSQASFTIFPFLVGKLLALFSAPLLFQSLTLFGLIAFLIASAWFSRALFSWERVLWSLLSLLVIPPIYGGYGVFSYSEGFFTARSLAEPLLIFAMGFGVRNRYLPATVLWLLATLLHPLQGIAVLCIAWLWLLWQDRRWLGVLPVTVVMAIALAFADHQWGTGFFAHYDSEWLGWIQEPNQHVFLSLWDFRSWTTLGVELFLLLLVALYFEGLYRRIALVLMAAVVVGCSLSLILADWLKLVLPTGLQLWRVTWVAQWWVALMLPQLLIALYRKNNHVSVEILIVVIVVSLGLTQGVAQPYAVLLLIPAYFLFSLGGSQLPTRTRVLAELGLWTAILVIAVKYFLFSWGLYERTLLAWNSVRLEFVLLTFPLFSGSILVLGWWLWWRNYWGVRAGLSCILMLLLVYSAMTWDQRPEWTRYIESQDASSPFSISLRNGAQIYWQDELLAPWLILKRPSYFSGAQGAGLLFNRGTAEEFYHRRKVTELLDMQTQVCNIVNGLNGKGACTVDVSALKDACSRGEGELDYLILPSYVEGYEKGHWILKRSRSDSYTYYLYDCRSIEQVLGEQDDGGRRGTSHGS